MSVNTNIEICKWYNNSSSPVMLFIDDLANVWVDLNGNGKVDLEEDWGYAKNEENSSFTFLNKKLLKLFPYIKITFFTPVGIRVGMIENSSIKSISKMINCDEETKKFFKTIYDNPKFEIAYHGTTHGKVGDKSDDFVQEWEIFKDLDEAVDTINYGKEIYKDVFGKHPKGGKYCGYESNEYSDESIDKTGFLWWCRYYNRGIVDNKNCSIGGKDTNSITNFDIKTFGENKVIDIPTTLDGEMFKDLLSLNPNINTLKGLVKFIFRRYFIYREIKKIDYLLKNNLIISIQEHISPARDDGRRQTPNIFDDLDSLIYIFNFLKGKNAWYCTCIELASYVYNRENSRIVEDGGNKFHIEYKDRDGLEHKNISIKIEGARYILPPSGGAITGNAGVFNIPIQNGYYEYC
jgi:hypothetical protein